MSSSTFYNSQSLVGIGSVGIGTTSPLAALHVQGSQYYTGDAVRSAAHLVPNQTNAPAIQNWINFTTSVANNPARSWWMSGLAGNYQSLFVGSTLNLSGGAYSSHGMVIFPPGDGSTIVAFFPETETSMSRSTTIPAGATSGGFAVPGNQIVCNPTYGVVHAINQTTLASTTPQGTIGGGQYSGCLTANNIIFAPQGTPSNVINYVYASSVASNVLALPSPGNYGQPWVTAGTNLPVSTGWRSITWSPQLGIFVAVPTSSATYGAAYSSDGKTWITAGTNLPVSTGWTVTWSPQLGIFVAVADSSATYGAAYSSDGKTWITAGTNLPISTGWRSLTWSPQLGIFVAVADSSATYGAAYSQGPALQQGIQLLTNGNVIIPSPGTSNVIQFDPVGLGSSNIFVGTDGFTSLTLAPNGNVIGTPNKSNIIVINPGLGISSNVTIPSANTNVFTFSLGACLLGSGNVFFTPSLVSTSTNVGSSNGFTFDTVSLKFSNVTGLISQGFGSAILVPSGKVVMTPGYNTGTVGIYAAQTPVDQTFCASPYFNKS